MNRRSSPHVTAARRGRPANGVPARAAAAAAFEAAGEEAAPTDRRAGDLPRDAGAERPLGELLLSQAHVAAFRATRAGDGLRVNAAFARLLGYESPRDLEGATLRNRIVDDADWSALARSLWSGGGVAGQYFQLRRRDGTTVTVAVEATAVVDVVRGGHVVFGLAIEPASEVPFLDGLHERERWFRAIADSGTHLVVVTDLEGRVRYANPAAEHLTGVRLDDARGKHVTEFLHPGDRAEAAERLREAIAAPGTRPSLEVRLARGPGGQKLVQATGTWLPQFPGAPSMLLYGRDVTAERKLEREYLHAQKLEAVALLSAGLAHDFNNLLTTVLGHAQMLRRVLAADDPARRSCEEIADAARRGAMLTRQLLALGKGQVVQPRAMRIGDVVRTLTGTLRRLLPENIRLEIEIDPAAPPVQADPGAIEQVLLNLIVNARDAIEGTGRIVVRVAPSGPAPGDRHADAAQNPAAELSVADDGCGMDAATLERIFEPFFTTKEPGRGSGLGLPAAQGLVRGLGGTILVESEPGRGATFRVRIPGLPPAETPLETPSAAEPPPAAEPVAKPASVLFVEDDAMILDVTRENLARRGHRVWSAADAAGALALAARLDADPPAVLVSDIVLPDEDGVTLARRLLQRWPGLRVVLTSGYSNHGAEVAGLVAEGHQFIEKPYQVDQLSRAIEWDARPTGRT